MEDRITDRFFDQTNCDRCYKPLSGGRTMSWFNTQTICMQCSSDEKAVKDKLKSQGENPNDYEGCGYIPKLD